MQPQAKECQQLLEAGRDKEGIPPWSLHRLGCSAHTLISAFQLLVHNYVVQATQFVGIRGEGGSMVRLEHVLCKLGEDFLLRMASILQTTRMVRELPGLDCSLHLSLQKVPLWHEQSVPLQATVLQMKERTCFWICRKSEF